MAIRTTFPTQPSRKLAPQPERRPPPVRPARPTYPTRRVGCFGLCTLIALLPWGCAAARPNSPCTRTARVEDELSAILGEQAARWNAGDIEGFMAHYWNSPDLTFSSSGKVTRGWKATLDRYQERYPDRLAMGHLTFDHIEVTPLGTQAALVLGRWRLQRDEPVGGAFSLVFRNVSGRWLIVHDHTSKDAP